MTIRPIHPRRLLIVLLAGFMSISSTIASPLADEAKSRVRLSHEATRALRQSGNASKRFSATFFTTFSGSQTLPFITIHTPG